MELRSVLGKKKRFEQDRVDRIEDRITRKTTVVFPDTSDIVTADRVQSSSLLYPLDAMILAAARATDAELVTFDAELLDHGAVEPSTLLADE